jgi:hypothetical protein
MIRKSGTRFSEKDHAPSKCESDHRFNLKQLRFRRLRRPPLNGLFGETDATPGADMPSKFVVTAALVSALVAPAYAQAPGSPSSSSSSTIGIPFNSDYPPSQEELERRKALDREYNAAVQKIPDKKPAADPWGDVRATTPSKKAKNNN